MLKFSFVIFETMCEINRFANDFGFGLICSDGLHVSSKQLCDFTQSKCFTSTLGKCMTSAAFEVILVVF